MDVLLVYPFAKTSKIENSVKVPPLGLAYIASVLESQGFSVGILDMNATGCGVEGFIKTLEKDNPKIVGFTCLTPFHSTVLKLCEISKLHGKVTLVGAAHATARYEELLMSRNIDCIVLGEGEITTSKLVHSLLHKSGNMYDVDGIAWRYGDKVYVNKSRGYIPDLDILPFPSRHLLALGSYKSIQIKGKNITSILTSRGCPYSCTFCDYRFLMGSKFRRRSPQNVVFEINECITKYNIDHFSFRDSTFTFDEDWISRFCELIKFRNLKFTWDCNGRVNLVTESMLRAMKDIGCNLISYGIESGCQRVLDIVQKHTTVEQSIKAIRMTRNAGIESLNYSILGLPTDDYASIKETVDHAKRLNADYTQFSLATPFPGTPLYDYALDKGFIRKGVTWDDFSPINKSIMRTESLDFSELEKELKQAYRRYYLSPQYLMRRIFSLRPSNIRQNFDGLKAFIGQQNG